MSALVLRVGRRTFRSLRRHRNYRLFFSGQVVSLIGTWMQNIALAWLVIELSGSATATNGEKVTAKSFVDAWNYGAYGPKKLYGKEVVGVIRSTFVIDEDGNKLEFGVVPGFGMDANRFAISSAARAASKPLFPALPPARS